MAALLGTELENRKSYPSSKPAKVSPPWRIIEEELAAREWNWQEFSARLGGKIHEIQWLKDGGSIDFEMSLRLSKAFGTSAEFWLNLQHNYDLFRLRELG